MNGMLRVAISAALCAASVAVAEAGGLESRVAKRMEAVLTEKMALYHLPGATAAAALEDGTVVSVAVGFADKEKGIPMRPDSRLASGSIGKTFVPVVAMMLEHDGVLALGDPISKYLGGETWFERLTNGKDITLAQLLTHSSGVSDHVYEPAWHDVIRERWAKEGNPEKAMTPAELVEFILDKEPLFPPGEGFAYTDTGYILAGMVIESATGKKYNNLVTEMLLKPLGLSLTEVAEGLHYDGLASGYMDGADSFPGMNKVAEDEAYRFSPLTEWTGGGMVTNSQDLARWSKMLYEGKVLDFPYLVPLLQMGYRGDLHHIYGLGVFIREDRAGLMYGHGGQYPGYNCSMYYFPVYRTSVAFQTNTNTGLDRNDIVLDLALAVQAELDGAAM